MSYLFIGVLIMWMIILGYMFRISQDQKKVSKQLEDLTRFTK